MKIVYLGTAFSTEVVAKFNPLKVRTNNNDKITSKCFISLNSC